VRLIGIMWAVDPLVAFLPGFAQRGDAWAPVAERVGQSYRSVCIDFGSFSFDQRLGEIASRVDDGDVIVGYSMGGRLALHLALARPDLVDGLVLLGATAGIEAEEERRARRTADEALAADLERGGLDVFVGRWLAQPLFASLPSDAADLDDRRRNTVAGLASSLRLTGTGTQEPLWDRLGMLTMPVLVLAGERDERFAGLGRRIAQTIGTNATFAVVPHAGHAAHLEEPEAFLRVLRDWLGVRRPGRDRA